MEKYESAFGIASFLFLKALSLSLIKNHVFTKQELVEIINKSYIPTFQELASFPGDVRALNLACELLKTVEEYVSSHQF
jgi:hypothetical protein